MKPIELECWEPSPDDPRRKVYAGQRTAQEVFEELKYRLENMGYLPDEYFLLNREWENGREIPKDADIFCTTDYGGSEGIYTDLYLKWYQDGDPVIKSFATGKTLGESGSDLDRMYLIASAITKAFHGDRGTYARYLRWVEQPEPEDMILHLNPAEQRTFIDEVGQRPLRLSDYDKAVLAIRDGEFDVFCSLYPKVPDQADDLLIEAAGRPGRTGGNMVRALLSAVEQFSPEAYLTACKWAVETGDSWRVRTMVEEAESHLSEPYPSLTGEVILHAYANDRKSVAKDLIDQCSPGQIAAAPPILLRQAAASLDFQTAVTLVDKGIQPGDYAADVLHTLTGQHQNWMAERLLEHGMPVAPDNYAALYACLNNGAADIGKLLLDRGIDLERYQIWAEKQRRSEGYMEAMEELTSYWEKQQTGPQQDGPSMGDMHL